MKRVIELTLPQPADENRLETTGPKRIVSLDQFRGYTVIGMLLVNFIGGFDVVPDVLKHHHDHCSYADTIMPQFLFAVGFAFRLTCGRRAAQQGIKGIRSRVVRRLLGLMLISMVIYTPAPSIQAWQQLIDQGPMAVLAPLFKRHWFQTLMHIAVTSLWLLPVIAASAKARILWMLGSAVAHVVLSGWFNYHWVNSSPNAIDGGPLAFLAWCVPATVGTLGCDIVLSGAGLPVARMLRWGLLLSAVGYLLSCGTRLYDVPPSQLAESKAESKADRMASDPVFPAAQRLRDWSQRERWRERLAEPPFVRAPASAFRKWNYWMMSQRAATLSYMTFSAGLSLLIYALFFGACDRLTYQSAILRTFGTNALAAYVLHDLVAASVKHFVPADSPAWYVTTSLGIFFLITWMFVRGLEKQNLFLRV